MTIYSNIKGHCAHQYIHLSLHAQCLAGTISRMWGRCRAIDENKDGIKTSHIHMGNHMMINTQTSFPM